MHLARRLRTPPGLPSARQLASWGSAGSKQQLLLQQRSMPNEPSSSRLQFLDGAPHARHGSRACGRVHVSTVTAAGTANQGALGGHSRGALIVFEGIDRCGKSTQGSRLEEHLRAQGVSGRRGKGGCGKRGVGGTLASLPKPRG